MGKQSEYIDTLGRHFAVELLDESDDPSRGMVVGPPFLDDLGLPEPIMVRLHNELFHRGILTEQQARARSSELAAALMAAFKVDVERIKEAYRGG